MTVARKHCRFQFSLCLHPQILILISYSNNVASSQTVGAWWFVARSNTKRLDKDLGLLWFASTDNHAFTVTWSSLLLHVVNLQSYFCEENVKTHELSFHIVHLIWNLHAWITHKQLQETKTWCVCFQYYDDVEENDEEDDSCWGSIALHPTWPSTSPTAFVYGLQILWEILNTFCSIWREIRQ